MVWRELTGRALRKKWWNLMAISVEEQGRNGEREKEKFRLTPGF